MAQHNLWTFIPSANKLNYTTVIYSYDTKKQCFYYLRDQPSVPWFGEIGDALL